MSGHDDHEHDHDHDDHDHDDHGHRAGVLGVIGNLFAPHSHDHTAAIDTATADREGMRALSVSFAGLAATAVLRRVRDVRLGGVARGHHPQL